MYVLLNIYKEILYTGNVYVVNTQAVFNKYHVVFIFITEVYIICIKLCCRYMCIIIIIIVIIIMKS